MESTLSNALLLMIVGMISVTLVLSIVVVGGSVLISIINRLHIEPSVAEIHPSEDKSKVNKNVLAVIAAVVAHVTDGTGRVEKVSKESQD